MWVRLDEKRAIHHKLLTAGMAASGLDVTAMCWSSLHENDGFISTDDLRMLAGMYRCDDWEDLAAVLVKVGRWTQDRRRKGYLIKDFLQYNPSRAELEARREYDRMRKKKRYGSGSDSDGNHDGKTAEP